MTATESGAPWMADWRVKPAVAMVRLGEVGEVGEVSQRCAKSNEGRERVSQRRREMSRARSRRKCRNEFVKPMSREDDQLVSPFNTIIGYESERCRVPWASLTDRRYADCVIRSLESVRPLDTLRRVGAPMLQATLRMASLGRTNAGNSKHEK